MSNEKTLGDRPRKTKPKPKKRFFTSIWDKLPPWISSNLRSWKSWKVLLRCWAAAWVCFVIMLPNKSLATLGNTAFFALMMSIMLPPSLPVQMYMIIASTLLLGILMGWAISCAAMKAALAARSQTLLKETLQKEAESAAGLANPDALFQVAVFHGDFLDTGSSAVFGVFLGFGAFLFALVRAYAPKLILMSVFGTIALDIFCSFGPLFPFPQYTVINSMVISIACYVAVSLVFVIFVFPESLNYAYLTSSAEIMDKFIGILTLQDAILRADPHDVVAGTPLASKSSTARIGMIMQLRYLMSEKQMLNLEFSWGRWNAEDIQDMLDPIQIVATRLGSLSDFFKFMAHPMSLSDLKKEETDSVVESTMTGTTVGDTYLLRQFRESNVAAEAKYNVRLAEVLPSLHEATADLRTSSINVLTSLRELVISINTKRYKGGHVEQDARLLEVEKALSALRSAMEDFKTNRRLVLLQPFNAVFEHLDAGEITNAPLRSLYISYAFTSNLMAVCTAIVNLAEHVSATAAKRTRAKLWMPSKLKEIWKFLRSKEGSGEEAVGEDTQPEETLEAPDSKRYKRDPDSRPPKNVMQRMANLLHKLYKWMKTPEALFTFRYVVVTIALWIPAVVKSSAYFSYAERGIWALIMSQTTMNIYASDQIFNYVTRFAGTVVGALVGMVCWYMGSGHGKGNAYGMGASSAAVIFPIIFFRLFAPHHYLMGTLMCGVTFTLVIGYGWIGGHLPVIKIVGFGWDVAWRRTVGVLIGSAASFILMMLPPKSGRKAVRLRNASVLSGLCYLYSHLTSIWLSAAEPSDGASNRKDGDDIYRVWPSELREIVIGFAEQLQDIRMLTALNKWEGNIRGKWAFEEYNKLVDLQTDMLTSLLLLAGSLTNIEPELRKATLPHTYVLNPHYISDVISMFFLISQSLRTGEPLHQAQYKNLSDRLHYHSHNVYCNPATEPTGLTGPHIGTRKVLRQSITTYEYMFYATAVMAVLQMSNSLNEVRTIVRDLCGEVPLEGFERWREEFDRSHVVV